jgi:peptide deformylase
MAREILHYPDPRLAEKAEDVKEITPEHRELAEEMAELMYANDGIGLAAPQVGEMCRLIVVDVSGPDKRTDLMTIVNPEIVSEDGQVESEEGCLSVPALKAKVRRSEAVTVKGMDLDGKEVLIEAEDLLAVCLQHEIEHCDGRVIVDHLSRLKKSLYEQKVKKWQKRKEKPSA